MTAQTKGVDVREVFASARRVAHLCDPMARAHQHPQSNSLQAQAFNLLPELDAAEAAIAELIEKGAAYRKAELACSEDHVGYRRLFDELQVARAEFSAALAHCGVEQ